MSMQRIKASEVMIGQPLAWDIYDANGILLLHKGYVIHSERQLEQLVSRGVYHNDEGDAQRDHSSEERNPFVLIDAVQASIDRVMRQWDKINQFPQRIETFALAIQKACHIDPDAALACVMITNDMRYSIRHALEVAIVCELVGRQILEEDAARIPTLCAALTMNLGMMELQDQLYYQKEALQPDQHALIKHHPARGVEMLREARVTQEEWLEIVLQHHESLDGSGYPRGLKGAAIFRMAQLLSLADLYCAKVSGRSYRPPKLANVALREIFLSRGENIDVELAAHLIKVLGIYQPGTFVRLKNQELAIVTKRGKIANSPIVHGLTNARGDVYIAPLERNTEHPQYQIEAVIPSAEANVRINRFQIWGYFNKQSMLS